ncbi:unnamed protein product [Anisakis simplex]|uniref:LD29223p (inferred by orthology to a D. melanogaster protein) n=1 Tax=Anisakis simplex TaxID=6269 RepID=A0A0M3JR57_ANISI|nr:unnamed protein product [Anisakis simplex]
MGPGNEEYVHGLYYPPSCSLKSYRLLSTSSLNRIFAVEPCLLEEFVIPVKSKFGVDIRRIGLHLGAGRPLPSFNDFYSLLCNLHHLSDVIGCGLSISYASSEGDRLPISNDQNLRKALEEKPKILRLTLQKKGESLEEQYGYGVPIINYMRKKKRISISNPQDFRRVSSIVDVDILPQGYRRVKLCKYYTNKPLGFYIRNGTTQRLAPWGVVTVNGIFISRLLPTGLAASTNLLAVNDEIIEVNGIEVAGKTLDQVTDMMIVNAYNLVLTVKPAIEQHTLRFSQQPPLLSPPNYECLSFPNQPLRSPSTLHPSPCHPPRGLPSSPTSAAIRSFSRTSTWRLSDKLHLSVLRSPFSRSSNNKFGTHLRANNSSTHTPNNNNYSSSNAFDISKKNYTNNSTRRPISVHFGAISLLQPKFKITAF